MQVDTEFLIDEELERVVLGACFGEDRTPIADVRAALRVDEFGLEIHQRLFRTLCVMADRGEPMTPTVAFQIARELNQPVELSLLIECESRYSWAVEKHIQRLKALSGRRRLVWAIEQLRSQSLDQSVSLSECVEHARALMQSVEDGSALPVEVETPDQIVEALGGIEEFFKPRCGVPSPWHEFNETTGGWNKSELSIIAARASMGKTSLALNALFHAARRRVPVVFYSCEMNQESILKRLVSLLTGISFNELQRAELNTGERRAATDALALISDLPLRIVAAAGKTVGAIRNHVERLHRKGLCDLAMLDYIGLIRGSDRNSTNRAHELGDICRQLKLVAAEMNIPFIVLAQLNRAVESRTDKHPTMADMRDSGELEEHGDMIALLYRPDYYDRDNPAVQGAAELIIAKQRNGPTPVIPLRFDYHRGMFFDPPQEDGR